MYRLKKLITKGSKIMNANTTVTVQDVATYISEQVGEKVKSVTEVVKSNTDGEYSITVFVSEKSPVVELSTTYLNECIFVIGRSEKEVDSEKYYALMYADDFEGESIEDLVEMGQLCVDKEGYTFDHVELV